MARTYSVKELFYTLQGEGAHAGRAAVFCRFSGCNLWTGLEKDRADAICTFCDTDFVGTNGDGGGKFKSAKDLAAAARALFPDGGIPYIVCTGGEPLLQLDTDLIDEFHRQGYEIAVETNGTIKAPDGIDWVCVSPKIGSKLVQKSGNELKLVYPQTEGDPEQFKDLDFDHFFLQPMDCMDETVNNDHTKRVIEFCKDNPQWRISLQSHKIMNIP